VKSTFDTLDRSRDAALGCSPSAFCWCGQACSAVARSRFDQLERGARLEGLLEQQPRAGRERPPIDIAMPAVQKNG
jgi:hypothetical protein